MGFYQRKGRNTMRKKALAMLISIAIVAGSMLPAMAITGTSIQRTHSPNDVAVPDDVPTSSWYWDAAKYVLDFGLMSTVNGAFAGGTAMTREQIAQALYHDAVARSMHIPDGTAELKGASDYASISASCKAGLAYCVATNVILGDSKHALHPKNLVTRQELATILMRYGLVIGYGTQADATSNIVDSYQDVAGIANWARGGVSYCSITDLVKGDEAGNFNPKSNISRAQFAQILLNLESKINAIWSRLS